MTLLESIWSPRDVKALTPDELTVLAGEIRAFLIEAVSRNGGHLGPNLGVVELTIALHRVFDSPSDPIVWDTGHQSYVHKLLTGRMEGFARLRQQGGVSGYPSRAESEHDLVKNTLSHTPLVGPPLFETLHGLKKGLKDVLQPQVLFEDLGLKYLGPVDGHDEQALEHALGRAREFGGPVLVHVITQKGHGYALAEENDEDCLHQVQPGAAVQLNGAAQPSAQAAPAASPAPAAAPASPAKRAWTHIFADELVDVGARRPDVVAITAAMLHPTGLAKFAQVYPDRVFDVGIAEQHAVTSAAGLAMGGM